MFVGAKQMPCVCFDSMFGLYVGAQLMWCGWLCQYERLVSLVGVCEPRGVMCEGSVVNGVV